MYVFISIGGNESLSCEGFKSDLDTPLFIGIGAVTITLITITIFMTIIIIVLMRGKVQLQMKLETSKINQNLTENMKIIYEEIKPGPVNRSPPSPTLNTRENSAYGCAQRVCT